MASYPDNHHQPRCGWNAGVFFGGAERRLRPCQLRSMELVSHTWTSLVRGTNRHHASQHIRVIGNQLVGTDANKRAYVRRVSEPCSIDVTTSCTPPTNKEVAFWGLRALGKMLPYLSLASLIAVGWRPLSDSLTIQYLEKAAQNGPGTWERRYHCTSVCNTGQVHSRAKAVASAVEGATSTRSSDGREAIGRWSIAVWSRRGNGAVGRQQRPRLRD